VTAETRQTLRSPLLLSAGALMGLSAVMDAFTSVPHLREDMAEIHVRPTLMRAVSLGLYFGAIAMFAFAAVVLIAGFRASRGRQVDRPSLVAIAAAYVVFGGTAFFVWGASGHILGYAFAGLLIVVAVLLPQPEGAAADPS